MWRNKIVYFTFALLSLRIHMSLVRLQMQKMQGLVHPYTNNWVERAKAIKRLRCRLQAARETQQQQQQQQKDDVGGKADKSGGGAAATPAATTAAGDPYLKLEITKEHIDAISDFSELL